MSDWTSGYVAEIGYTYGYYSELNPIRARLPIHYKGYACPKFENACELGFGQGVSVNYHAAGSNSSWYGTDFNPSQACFAQHLNEKSEANAVLSDESFAEFCARKDLPDFDFIGLHGIWSWVSDDNRKILVDFVRRKLRVGGVLYVSYNTMPGWASFVPLRDLMHEHTEVIGSTGRGLVSSIEDALEFANTLLGTNPLFAQANPLISERIKSFKNLDRNYLAHEFFNKDWQPMSFAGMARWLEPAKLNWSCSAGYLDAIDSINLTGEQQAMLQKISDPMFRQTIRDFCVNQQFRRDYWVKGARKLSALEYADTLRNHTILLAEQRADVSLKTKGSLGEATLQETIYSPILNQLADHKPKTLGQIEQALMASEDGRHIKFAQLLEAVMLLSGTGVVHAVQDDVTAQKAHKKTDRLNTHLMNAARSSNEIKYLVSPVTGGGINVGRFQQLFLLARQSGHKQPKELAGFVWDILEKQGQRIIKENETLQSAEENIAELVSQAQLFVDKQLPILKALQIG